MGKDLEICFQLFTLPLSETLLSSLYVSVASSAGSCAPPWQSTVRIHRGSLFLAVCPRLLYPTTPSVSYSGWLHMRVCLCVCEGWEPSSVTVALSSLPALSVSFVWSSVVCIEHTTPWCYTSHLYAVSLRPLNSNRVKWRQYDVILLQMCCDCVLVFLACSEWTD